MKDIFRLIKTTFKEWREDNATRLSAALAYYTIFSIPPMLLIALAVAGQFFDRQAASDQLMAQISGVLGPQGADMVKTMLENASHPAAGVFASIVGVITLLLGASGVMGELQGSLNVIWEVKPRPGRGFWGTVKNRLFSFSMVLGVGFLLLVSLILSTTLSSFSNFLSGGSAATLLVQVFDVALSFGVTTVLFALIFKIVPDAEIAWRDVWWGGVVTALLFTIGKQLIGLYLGRAGVTSAYGAAGSLVVVLLWVYYSAQILFFGAEFTQVYANQYGSRIRPAPDAEPARAEDRRSSSVPQPSSETTHAAPVAGSERLLPVPVSQPMRVVAPTRSSGVSLRSFIRRYLASVGLAVALPAVVLWSVARHGQSDTLR